MLCFSSSASDPFLLAQAVATEARANFLPVSISELMRSGVGDSEKAVDDVFRCARVVAPCVVFFDEFQSVFSSREQGGRLVPKLVSQLLMHLDLIHEVGTRSAEAVVIVLAATNCPQAIDTTFLRPGRFDRLVYVAPPSAADRRSILEAMRREMGSWHHDVRMEELVSRTHHFTGADLKNLCQRAGLVALQRHSASKKGSEAEEEKHSICMRDFGTAIELCTASVTIDSVAEMELFQARYSHKSLTNTQPAITK
jgi:transitional endoplasmic reticulum ATPase